MDIVKLSEGRIGTNFLILNDDCSLAGIAVAHLEGDELVVDWVSGHSDSNGQCKLGDMSVLRVLLEKVKLLFPTAKKISGNRLPDGCWLTLPIDR